MKKRKGFTLIELMIVIAIIIILAAIAIPNYLRMTDRARRSRVAGDFVSTATALEAYSVDWGKYVTDTTADQFGKPTAGNSYFESELTGNKTASTPATVNISTATTLTGESGGIEYFKPGTIQAMYNPFVPTDADDDSGYYYLSDTNAEQWVLYCRLKSGAGNYLYRSDKTTDLAESTTAPVYTDDELTVISP